ncbi:hypothetical protein [Streptomyces sp. NBC_00015]|uniref:hypothetical protein n=1 Tax=Streptomyces sp. NBC_00015 TaxID=2903611 RepID=UPI003862D429
MLRSRLLGNVTDGAPHPDGPPEPPKHRRHRRQPAAGRGPLRPPVQPEVEIPAPLADVADPRAVAVRTALRRVDPRLVLSAR